MAKAIDLASSDSKKMASRLFLIYGNAKVLKDTNLVSFKDNTTGHYGLMHNKGEIICEATYDSIQKIQGTTFVKVGTYVNDYGTLEDRKNLVDFQGYGISEIYAMTYKILDSNGVYITESGAYDKYKLIPGTKLMIAKNVLVQNPYEHKEDIAVVDTNFKTVIPCNNYISLESSFTNKAKFFTLLHKPLVEPGIGLGAKEGENKKSYNYYFDHEGKYLGTAKVFFARIAKLGVLILAQTREDYKPFPNAWFILDKELGIKDRLYNTLGITNPELLDNYHEIDPETIRATKEYEA